MKPKPSKKPKSPTLLDLVTAARAGSRAAGCYAFLWANGGWDKKNWKRFELIEIPWGMVAPHDAQAKANHCGQDLAKLQSRAGVSYCEALAILDDRPWRAMDENEAHDELKRRVDAYTHNSPSSATATEAGAERKGNDGKS